MAQNEYQGLIFTNHALRRMKERGITHQNIWETYKFPDFQAEKKNDSVERSKKFGKREISVIFKHNEKNEIVIVSCWMEPPFPGSSDAKEKEWWKKYKNAGFWGKLWLQAVKQLIYL